MEPLEGIHLKIFHETARLVDVEGALSSAKTTTLLLKEIAQARENPGIDGWIFRYSQTDTDTKLQPAYDKLLADVPSEHAPEWDKKEQAYVWPNGSRTFCFGIQSGNSMARYRKLRGVGVARAYCDQGEEIPHDVFLEISARLRQPNYPHQFTISPNPVSFNHWIAKYEFPEKNMKPGRALYQLSIYDNPWLPKETVEGLEAAYPIGHGKRAGAILGKRGANIFGDPIYEGIFLADRHVTQLEPRKGAQLYEAFVVGQQNCAWVVAQRGYAGGLQFLGGLMGQDMFLEDFLPIVEGYRVAWFKDNPIETCCGTASEVDLAKFTTYDILRSWLGHAPRRRSNCYDPDVQVALIERIAGYMRRRSITGGEMLAVNSRPDRWLRVSSDGPEACPFLSEAFGSGYTWAERNVSVGNRSVRTPSEDGWSEHGMRCAEWIELNFGLGFPTEYETAQEKTTPKPPPFHRPSGASFFAY